MSLVPLILCCVILTAAVHLDKSGTHLVPVLLGMALAQGGVLLVAAGELSNAKWLKPVKRPLLTFAPLLVLFPVLVKLAPYPWLLHPNRWLTGEFFILRNIVGLLLLAIVARVYARFSLGNAPSARKWAVVYILTFVTIHTMVAMDWTMSLDYPWFSTMYPVLYMVECLYAGAVLVGLFCYLKEQRHAGSTGATVYDGASLLFGFALFWGGLTFAQYLTIWYANIPEEVHYFSLRFAKASGPVLFTLHIVLLFLIPFATLLSHPARKRPAVFLGLGTLGLLGLFVSRIFQVFPHLNLDFGMLGLQTVAMLGVIGFTVRHGLQAE